ncbi:MAG: hypothetical protein ACI4V5_06390 [Prevotella sp.]
MKNLYIKPQITTITIGTNSILSGSGPYWSDGDNKNNIIEGNPDE